MAAKILAKDEKGKLPCELCGVLFNHIGNGEWIPTCCPNCKAEGGYMGYLAALMTLTPEEELTIDEIINLATPSEEARG